MLLPSVQHVVALKDMLTDHKSFLLLYDPAEQRSWHLYPSLHEDMEGHAVGLYLHDMVSHRFPDYLTEDLR
jgi:hypothetical protein